MRACAVLILLAIVVSSAPGQGCAGGGLVSMDATTAPVGGNLSLTFASAPNSSWFLFGGAPGSFAAPPLGTVCLNVSLPLIPLPLPISIPASGSQTLVFPVLIPPSGPFYLQALVSQPGLGPTLSNPLSIEFTLPDSSTPAQGTMTGFVALHATAAFGDGRYVFVSGGGNGVLAAASGGQTDTAEIYDHYTRTFITGLPTMAGFRKLHTATRFPTAAGEAILVTGGETNAANNRNDGEFYDPASNAWTPAGTMSDSRAGHTATLLDSGKVLVCGGNTSWTISTTHCLFGTTLPAPLVDPAQVLTSVTPSTDIFDPATGSFLAGPAMIEKRAGHAAVKLPGGQVMVAGGVKDGTCNLLLGIHTPVYAAGAELFDPVTSSWSGSGALASPRAFPAMAVLPSGRVIVAGGANGTFITTLDSTEIWDPATGLWTPGPTLPVPVGLAACTTLPDGSVILFGGATGTLATVSPVAQVLRLEETAPGIVSVTPLASLPVPVASHAANLLADGSVLLTGGENVIAGSVTSVNTATIWTPPL